MVRTQKRTAAGSEGNDVKRSKDAADSSADSSANAVLAEAAAHFPGQAQPSQQAQQTQAPPAPPAPPAAPGTQAPASPRAAQVPSPATSANPTPTVSVTVNAPAAQQGKGPLALAAPQGAGQGYPQVLGPTHGGHGQQSPRGAVVPMAADKGSAICAFPLSGPWISSHTIHPQPVVIKRPDQNITAKWGMNIYHDITQWGKDWGVVMISSPGPQRTLAIGDIILGVNGISLGGKTFTEAVTLLKEAGIYCHLAVARFTGFMTVIVEVPKGVAAGDLILAKCPDGTNVDVRVPDGLQPGDRFQLQIRQPQYNSEAALLSNNAAKANAASGNSTVAVTQQQAAEAQQAYLAQQAAYQEQQRAYQQQQEQLRRQQQQQIAAQGGGKPGPIMLSDPQTVSSGDFTRAELQQLVEAVRLHGMDFSKALVSTRGPDQCKVKWGQVVAKFEAIMNAGIMGDVATREKEYQEVLASIGESKRKTSKAKKEAEEAERAEQARVNYEAQVLASGVAHLAPSLTVCVITAITNFVNSTGGPPTAAEMLLFISNMFGRSYKEPGHADWSYRIQCLPHITNGMPKVFVANPVQPDKLSFEGPKFVMDEAKVRSLREGTADLELILLAHELICNKTNLQAELNLLVSTGVIVYDNTGCYGLAEDWASKVDVEVLDTMTHPDGWGGKNKDKYLVPESCKAEINKVWKKKGTGWFRTLKGTAEPEAKYTAEMMAIKTAYMQAWMAEANARK
ncbi:hypothetical protein TeGR_g8097 [Tetraparma gracilis]|uniref:PDZ domain-containing protein n=1 Tax=Tetraparma gracilis TaxID=2962635 RepID=A0ABQ6MQH7_9STRA|nr:hypothetical protein TeGR_g8097 [Tetraparma gracilis]